MEKKIKDINILDDFPKVSTKEWVNAIIKDLKGTDFDNKMLWKTVEGFNLNPFYREEDISNFKFLKSKTKKLPVVRGYKTENNNWEISQEITVENFTKANKQAISSLKNGADCLTFVLNDNTNLLQSDVHKLLNNIALEKIKIRFITNFNFETFFELIENELKNRNIDFKKVQIEFNFAPISYFSITGDKKYIENKQFLKYSKLIKQISENLPESKAIGINAYDFANAGSLITQELAYSLAIASEYLSIFSDKGLDVKTIAKQITFNFAIGSNYFFEISKLRSIRMLWAKLLEAFIPDNSENIPINLNSVTTDWNKSSCDIYNNVLRQTTEAMAAIIGGTQSLTVRPFNSILGIADDFSNNLARNLQIILKEETHLNKVADIAGGSYYIENLTNNITNQAWKLFLEIEEKGGYIKAFKDGFIQTEIKHIQQQHYLAIATQKEVLLGVNRYPDLTEKYNKSQNKKRISKKQFNIEPIEIFRGAEAFEKLRLETEKLKQIPKVFLFTFGNLAQRKARAFFAANFFGCAGFDIIDNPGFEDIKDIAKAALNSKAEIVVICSSDDEYIEVVPQIAAILKNKTILVLACNPNEMIETYKDNGIEHFVYAKSNILEELKNFQFKISNKLK